ncbi:MAG: FAD-binding oxidoreductase [Candidatus Andersenbacteria bacterium]|nr:FAD-binding oxidoreductase [Candidatus Andersenbacteria bacterium]MBI3250940.1 FAD-binding oxidoreductase [Candidatus Andersenbacteria bacterium]
MSNSSWGNYLPPNQSVHPLLWRTDDLPTSRPLLAFGMGRSYGDVALNEDGTSISTRFLNHFISFNPETGLLRCEAGVSLGEILKFITPKGWFLPVTPGTKFVSLGGAIANDVHGKNHHRAGSFGAYVTQFELLRSNGRITCSSQQNTELFKATIGGLGLTGLITWAEIQLKKAPSRLLAAEATKTEDLTQTIELLTASLPAFEYVIASLDSSARGRKTGRGIVLRGNHLPEEERDNSQEKKYYRPPKFTVPITLPVSLLNSFTIKIFNTLYFYRQIVTKKKYVTHYEPFFYPQDAIGYWNRLYGRNGFLQYQCQVTTEKSGETLHTILQEVAAAGFASPITTLKPLGKKNTPALLSFPRPGFTLAMDFPHAGEKLLNLFQKLDDVVLKAGGSLYPAKDAHMSPAMFRHSYPEAAEFKKYIDPAFSSSFWKRVTKNT